MKSKRRIIKEKGASPGEEAALDTRERRNKRPAERRHRKDQQQ